MGFVLGFEPKSLRDSFRGVAAQRMLYGVILLIVGAGLIMVTVSAQTFMPLYDGTDSFLNPVVSRTARFFIGAGFIAVAMVLFALATETRDTCAEASPYSIYSYSA